MSHIEPKVGEFGYIAEDDDRFSNESFLRNLGWVDTGVESSSNDNNELAIRRNAKNMLNYGNKVIVFNYSDKVITEKVFDAYVDKGFTFDDASRHFFGVGIDRLRFDDGMVSVENVARSNISKNIAQKAIDSSINCVEIK